MRSRSSAPLQVGIIGCGNVLSAYAATLEKPRSQGLAETRVACGRESQREKAKAWLRVGRFTTEAAQVIHDPNVELVVILTSMPEHGPLARAALEVGKHVLVEKPMSTSLEEAHE